MTFIKTIMAAVDLSKYSPATARYAAQLAQALDAGLLVVNVINQRDIDTVQRIMTTYENFKIDTFIRERVQARQEEVNELLRSCDIPELPTQVLVRIGVPYQQLLAIIEEKKPDLLVMATKGRSDIVDVVMGSCARSLHRRSPIPVLMVRG